jgi:hypothetical protein
VSSRCGFYYWFIDSLNFLILSPVKCRVRNGPPTKDLGCDIVLVSGLIAYFRIANKWLADKQQITRTYICLSSTSFTGNTTRSLNELNSVSVTITTCQIPSCNLFKIEISWTNAETEVVYWNVCLRRLKTWALSHVFLSPSKSPRNWISNGTCGSVDLTAAVSNSLEHICIRNPSWISYH